MFKNHVNGPTGSPSSPDPDWVVWLCLGNSLWMSLVLCMCCMCYQRSSSTCRQVTYRHTALWRGGVEFLLLPPHRKPFPIGDKVTFSGKECLCQTCSQSMTSSKPIKIRGPSRESSPLGASPSASTSPRAPLSQFHWPFPSAAWREVGAVPTLEDSWSMTQLADSPDSWASLHTNAGKIGCPTVNRDGLGHVSAAWVVLLGWAGLLVSPLVHAAWSTPTELIRCFPPVALNS